MTRSSFLDIQFAEARPALAIALMCIIILATANAIIPARPSRGFVESYLESVFPYNEISAYFEAEPPSTADLLQELIREDVD